MRARPGRPCRRAEACATARAEAGAPAPGETGARARDARVETETDLVMRGAARGARETVTKQEAAEGRAGTAVEVNRPFGEHAAKDVPVIGDWLAGKLYGSARNAAPDGAPKAGRGRPADERDWGDSSP